MRMLNSDESGQVAGGMDEVTVTGRRIGFIDPLFAAFLTQNGAFANNHSSLTRVENGRDGDGEQPRETNCVTDKPADIAIIDLHQAAIDLKFSEKTGGMHRFENFALLFRMPGSSEIRVTTLQNDGHIASVGAAAVWAAADQLPANAVIVRMYHSDPYGSTMSPPDWRSYSALFGDPSSPRLLTDSGLAAVIGRGITADPYGLSYVYDKSTGKIHVYDKSDVGSDQPQCHVNGR